MIYGGPLKSDPGGASTAQSYRFPKSKFTVAEAKKWLKDHNISYTSFEPAEKKDIMNHDIYVYGDIWNDQSDESGERGSVSLTDIAKQINESDDGDELIVHIHSRGGDVSEGFAIHDILASSGREITTIIEGLCASIATIVALAGTERKMTENSTFMIHNPFGGAFGEAEKIQKYADELKEIQDKIIDFYADKTGGNRDRIADLVNEETVLTAEEAQELGFVTEIIETVKAVAYIDTNIKSNKNNIDMKDELKDLKKEVTGLKAFFTTLFNLKDDGVKNLKLLTADGTKLIIDTEDTKPAVGDKVSVSGDTKLQESYIMPDGETINIKDNVIESIVPKKVEDEDDSEELKNLKQKVVDQEKEISTLKTTNESYKKDITDIKKDMAFVVENVKSTFVIDDKTRIAMKNAGGVEDPVAEAIARRKERKEAANKKK